MMIEACMGLSSSANQENKNEMKSICIHDHPRTAGKISGILGIIITVFELNSELEMLINWSSICMRNLST